MSTTELEQLTALLSRLPSLGPRSAQRALLHLLERKESLMQPLILALKNVEKQIKPCHICGNLDSSDPCNICTNTGRDKSKICVVENVADLWAMERANVYNGYYIVLGGVLSALDGISPSDLAFDALCSRAAAEETEEVILALGATIDGQSTAYYIADLLEDLDIKLTKLAQGLPIGGELDYMDEGTLLAALKARRPA